MKKKSIIYISGHSGMLGKTLHKILVDHGYKNIAVKCSSDLDLKNSRQTENFFKKERPEYVFHFAARVGGIVDNVQYPVEFLSDNLKISLNVINSAYKFGVKKLLNLGSSCVYPRECKQPMKEEYLFSGKFEPTNEGYALAKVSALKLCEYYNKQHGTNYLTLMPCNLYGINERFDPASSHVIAGLICKFHEAKLRQVAKVTLWGTGEARREFLYVEDMAKIALFFMENFSVKDLRNSFINIGSGKDYAISDLAKIIANIIGFSGEIRWNHSKPDGMPRKLLDITKMKNFYSFPLISLEKGVKLTYDYFLKTQNSGSNNST